ncbi:MAG: DUF6261 family protein [Tannerellaceae bacterium]|jgi:hypothetical protein|nr:DUF6261 family protein [Tannerellaceae bacterium]
MKILAIDLKRLRVEEWFGIISDQIELITKFGADKLGIMDLFALLLPLHNKMDRVLQVLQKNIYTVAMKKVNVERNKYFRGLYNIVKISRKFSVPAEQEAAERLFVLLSSYRKTAVQGGSYVEESNAVYNLLQELEGKYSADVTLLDVNKWVANLRAAEDKFRSLRAGRTEESIDKPKDHMVEIRKQTDIVYRSISDMLNAKLVADGLGGDVAIDPEDLKTGIYEDAIPPEQRGNVVYNFVIAWNETVEKYNNILAARAGQRRGKDEEPEPDEPSGPIED